MTPPRAPVAPPVPQVRVRSTQDLLSVVPYALGYQPSECLLVVCVRADGDVGLVATTELEDLRSPQTRAEVSGIVADRAAEDATTTAYVIVYTVGDSRPGSIAYLAARAFAAALRPLVQCCESWVVGAQRYRSFDCKNPECCPPDGFPLTALESTVPGAQLVLEGRAPLPSLEALCRVPRASPERRALVRRAAARWERERERPAEDWRVRSYADWVDAVGRLTRRRDQELPAALLGRLAVALEDRVLRDAVLLWCIPGYEALAASTAAGGRNHPDEGLDEEATTRRAMAGVVDPASAVPPDRSRARAATAVLEAVVAHAARERTASPLTLLAFLAWWSGEGSRAAFRAAEALAVDPTHRLARLLGAALRAGLPPGWVRSRSKADVSQGGAADLG